VTIKSQILFVYRNIFLVSNMAALMGFFYNSKKIEKNIYYMDKNIYEYQNFFFTGKNAVSTIRVKK